MLSFAAAPLSGDTAAIGAVVRRFVAAVNARDLDSLDALVATGGKRHCAATPDVDVHSIAGLRAFLRGDFAAAPDSRQEIQQMPAGGDRVAVRVICAGTQTGPMGPFPASGKRPSLPLIPTLRVADSRIAEIRVE